ncbi:hypothetical protein N9A94_08270 [Akkermansiaceae bacterium]|nr:hypothetical protein [Akkermansiaceae bacterium]MDA7888032.1 hypothetical protein [Akkermansiaceae bacterium]
MKLPSTKRLWFLSLAVLILWAVFNNGHERELQLNTDTGRSRHLHSLYGFNIWINAPQTTRLSDWCQSEKPEKNWLGLGNHHSSSLKKSFHDVVDFLFIIQTLKGIEYAVQHQDDRKKFAELILAQLSSGVRIDSVMDKCQEVSLGLQKLHRDQDFEKQPVSFEQLEHLWKHPDFKE